ncbi:hypothetical protein PPERSA_02838 [Pseudocohnilembus persalinus]|uniref:Uncharacterized protein n=1 Tax=Pseudocohnilembus persalinus TaxID=266149 RepID=A0A0V0QMA1_PSEPJ|nr:hypothetical protein PPERSA_02838 [Pseudocohnilembus persalinus]|eukprot:KRX03459.1 hypothetical protein PPERSA_02838 [Pseudocohnilembus persalinus]
MGYMYFMQQKLKRVKNLFETGHGNGSDNTNQRKKWENDIFNNIYNDAQPTERVKYGVLNFLSSPQGHNKCGFYGKSFFIMKEVRLRCTFSNKDTSALNPILLIDKLEQGEWPPLPNLGTNFVYSSFNDQESQMRKSPMEI